MMKCVQGRTVKIEELGYMYVLDHNFRNTYPFWLILLANESPFKGLSESVIKSAIRSQNDFLGALQSQYACRWAGLGMTMLTWDDRPAHQHHLGAYFGI